MGGMHSSSQDRIDEQQLWGLFRCSSYDKFEPLFPGSLLGDKVLLYVHGWQPGHNVTAFDPDSARRKEFPALSEGFMTPDVKEYGERFDTAEPWRQAGYDVICFCWAPIADEALPSDVERKIWEQKDEGVHLQWKCPVSGYRSEGMPQGSVGQAFSRAWEEVVTARGARRPSYLHVVGHSLGCQLSCSFLKEQAGVRGELAQLVQRWTLLDPYFTNLGKVYLDGRWPGEVIRDVVTIVGNAGAVVEQYRSSKVLDNPLSDSNISLQKMVAYYVMQPDFLPIRFGPQDVAVLAGRHSASKYVYFRSKATTPAQEVVFKSPAGPYQPLMDSPGVGYAGLSDDHVREQMNSDSYWLQVCGTDTADPALHKYERKRKSEL